MRILQISADRSKRGILFPGTDAYARQEAYAKQFGNLDVVAFSRVSDSANISKTDHLAIYPTNSFSRLLYIFDAIRLAKTLPKPSVVSAQDPFEAGLAAYFIAKRFNVPLHVQVHTDVFSPEFARHSLLNRLRIHLAKYVLKNAKGVRVVSERIKRSLVANNATVADVSVLPIFADVQKFRTAQATPELTAKFSTFASKLLVVSRLEHEKNVGLAIHAFAAGAPQNTCLIIAGEGSARERLEALPRALHVSDRVFFEGAQDPASYYALCDLVLVTSHFEGYGLVIIEALAAGKPALSTDVGIAREAGAIVTDETRFAEALKQWFTDGPRQGELKGYPYTNFDEYVRAYCQDIERCIQA